jgi:hypothetical protein
MSDEAFFKPTDIRALDFFQMEAHHFERDVHILILGTLFAALASLNDESKEKDEELTKHIKAAQGAHAEYLIDKQIEGWSNLADQERFLRNMALVALLTRLTHALHEMARQAEIFAPPNAAGYPGDYEFKKIWAEYRERFGIIFGAKYIQFIEPLRSARNMIVHNGGEATPPLPFAAIDPAKGDEGYYDPRCVKKYPKFVEHDGGSPKVNISEKQLNQAIKKAVELVNHTAARLRAQQIEAAKKEEADAKNRPMRGQTPKGVR